MPSSWFLSSTPVLDQLGATIGRGTSAGTANEEAIIRDYLARQREESDRAYQLQKDELDQRYTAARLTAKSQQERNEIDHWYNKQQVAIARDRLAEDARQFDATNSLNQAKLGYDVLGKMADLRGPSNYYQASEYARGVAGNPQSSTFLSALQNNMKLAGFGAQAGIPEPETYGTLSAKLQGGTGLQQGAPSADATLAQIGNIAAKGAHQLTGGSLEQLTPTELGLFTSGLDKLGIDTPTFLDQYRRSRIGNSLSNYRAA